MVKLLENQTKNDNIFLTLKNDSPADYSELFGNTEPDNLYYMLINMGGQRNLNPFFKEKSTLTIMDIVLSKYKNNWLKVKTAINGDYDIFNPYKMTTDTIENITAKETNDGTNKNTSSVYGFNSDVGSESDENLTEKNSVTDTTNDRDTNKTVTGNSGNKTPPELIQQELEIRKTNYFDIVLNDIMNYMTLEVY